MTYIIPNPRTKEIRQPNVNDLLGEIYSSKNIDLSTKGYIRLAHRTVAPMTEDNDADFDTVDAMFIADNGLNLISKEVFRSSDIGFSTISDIGSDTNSPSPSVEEGGVFFNATEVISDGTAIKYRSAASTWTSIAQTVTSGQPTTLENFEYHNALLIGNSNKVYLIDTSWVLNVTLTLPAQYQVTAIAVNNSIAAIATRHISGGEAKMFLWDGNSSAHNGIYGVDTHEIFSVRKYLSSFALITSNGQLLQFNGGGFTELGVLPVFGMKVNWADTANDHDRVSCTAMVVDEKDIYIRLDSQIEEEHIKFKPNFQGGVWKYNPDSGLNCMYGPSFTTITSDTIATTDVNTTTNVITVTAAPVTGTPILYEDGAGTILAGLQENKVYYCIYVSATTLKLAETYADALAGTAIDLTGTGNNAQSLKIFNICDYGYSWAGKRGSMAILNKEFRANSFHAERIVFSANIISKTSTTEKTVFNIVNPLLPNIGYFITPKLMSGGIEDLYNTLSIKYKTLGPDDVIKIKYRITDRYSFPVTSFTNNQAITGVWVDTNTFTTTVDMSNAAVGDEIEILAGSGAGWSSHIESISENAGTYTINLTDSFIWAVASDIMYFSCDNWSIFETITSATQTGDGYYEKALDKNSKFAQFKVELNGVDITIEEFRVGNKRFKDDRL